MWRAPSIYTDFFALRLRSVFATRASPASALVSIARRGNGERRSYPPRTPSPKLPKRDSLRHKLPRTADKAEASCARGSRCSCPPSRPNAAKREGSLRVRTGLRPVPLDETGDATSAAPGFNYAMGSAVGGHYAKRMSIYVASDKFVPATVANALHAFFEPLDIDALIILDNRAAWIRAIHSGKRGWVR
jgi:hypothetical protein